MSKRLTPAMKRLLLVAATEPTRSVNISGFGPLQGRPDTAEALERRGYFVALRYGLTEEGKAAVKKLRL